MLELLMSLKQLLHLDFDGYSALHVGRSACLQANAHSAHTTMAVGDAAWQRAGCEAAWQPRPLPTGAANCQRRSRHALGLSGRQRRGGVALAHLSTRSNGRVALGVGSAAVAAAQLASPAPLR